VDSGYLAFNWTLVDTYLLKPPTCGFHNSVSRLEEIPRKVVTAAMHSSLSQDQDLHLPGLFGIAKLFRNDVQGIRNNARHES
jgi:hypothetical protein